MLDVNKPVKCEECATWWRGLEHCCPQPSPKSPTKKEYHDYKFPKEVDYKEEFNPNKPNPRVYYNGQPIV